MVINTLCTCIGMKKVGLCDLLFSISKTLSLSELSIPKTIPTAARAVLQWLLSGNRTKAYRQTAYP